MSSAIDRRLRKLESADGNDIGYVIREHYPGQSVEEAWRQQHGDRPIPAGRVFAFLPQQCATVEEWLEQFCPEMPHAGNRQRRGRRVT
jgi:hypothetical protein